MHSHRRKRVVNPETSTIKTSPQTGTPFVDDDDDDDEDTVELPGPPGG
jgi:hypothetical protein